MCFSFEKFRKREEILSNLLFRQTVLKQEQWFPWSKSNHFWLLHTTRDTLGVFPFFVVLQLEDPLLSVVQQKFLDSCDNFRDNYFSQSTWKGSGCMQLKLSQASSDPPTLWVLVLSLQSCVTCPRSTSTFHKPLFHKLELWTSLNESSDRY